METQKKYIRELNVSKLESEIADAKIKMQVIKSEVRAAGRNLAYAFATPIAGLLGACPLLAKYVGHGTENIGEIATALVATYFASRAMGNYVRAGSHSYKYSECADSVSSNEQILSGETPEQFVPNRYFLNSQKECD